MKQIGIENDRDAKYCERIPVMKKEFIQQKWISPYILNICWFVWFPLSCFFGFFILRLLFCFFFYLMTIIFCFMIIIFFILFYDYYFAFLSQDQVSFLGIKNKNRTIFILHSVSLGVYMTLTVISFIKPHKVVIRKDIQIYSYNKYSYFYNSLHTIFSRPRSSDWH